MKQGLTERMTTLLLGLYVLDRAAKLAAVVHFFRRPAPPAPEQWPSLTLIQPITAGATALAANLDSRLGDRYHGTVEHLLVCDAADTTSQAVCHAAIRRAAGVNARVITVERDGIAPKITKMQAALQDTWSDIVCFVDDDIAFRPDSLDRLVRHLLQPGAGAVFGLASYVWWRDVPSSLMSLFVNANALLSYVPLVYLAEPFTITGHCYAVRRATFDALGGFADMDHLIDDDHDLARRIRRHGLRNVQTPLIYDVSNDLPTMRDYQKQMKRWFVLPRQTMMPEMTRREQAVSALGSAGNLVPTLLALIALAGRSAATLRALLASIALAASIQWLLETRYTGRATPLRRWLLFPLVIVLTPVQIIAALVSDDTIEWRGQRLQVERGGEFRTLTTDDRPRTTGERTNDA